jgi:hypothetical protein
MPEPLYEATTAAIRLEARFYGYFLHAHRRVPVGGVR